MPSAVPMPPVASAPALQCVRIVKPRPAKRPAPCSPMARQAAASAACSAGPRQGGGEALPVGPRSSTAEHLTTARARSAPWAAPRRAAAPPAGGGRGRVAPCLGGQGVRRAARSPGRRAPRGRGSAAPPPPRPSPRASARARQQALVEQLEPVAPAQRRHRGTHLRHRQRWYRTGRTLYCPSRGEGSREALFDRRQLEDARGSRPRRSVPRGDDRGSATTAPRSWSARRSPCFPARG